jgi:hypothetical protein
MIREKLRKSGSLDMAWIERTLRDAAMQDLAQILEGFLNHEVPQLLGDFKVQPDERFHSYQSRKVTTVAGPITLRRAYYLSSEGGRFPLDEVLGLHDQYTPAVRQLMCWAGAMDPSFEQASETLHRFAGLRIPGRQVQRIVNAWGRSAANWMQQRPCLPPSPPGQILNIQVDMTGIPMQPKELKGVKGKQPDGSAKTKQIKVGCVFTQSIDAKAEPQRDPFSSTYLTGFQTVFDFGHMLYLEALKRGYTSAQTTVFLGDGAEWIWNLATDRFKGAVQILDFYHAAEHIHTLCKSFETDEIRIHTLFKKWRRLLLRGGLTKLLRDATKRTEDLPESLRDDIETQLAYFRKNAGRMRYKIFRAKGYFIGSGAIEGACRHVVAQRTKLSGMRWHCSGAEQVLAFRALIKSGLFDDYCDQNQIAA